MERQEPCFLVRCKKNGAQKIVSVPLSSPGRQDAAPRRCTFASGPPPPLPPVPSTRATPWDPRAARSFAFAHAACTRPGWGGDRGLAPQQCSRSCTASANQLQLQCTAKNPLAGSTYTCARPLARPFLPHRPRAPQRPPQRAAPCTAHRSCKTSTDTHRTCAAAPTRPQRTRCSREGIDAQAAHWQVSGGTVTPARRSKGGTRCVGAKSPSAHTSIGPRAHPLSRA